MAQQVINTGTQPNSGTGDPLRTAGTKINSNFTEVYATSQASFNQANTANTLAQAAFNYANTIVSDTQIDPYARVTANASFLQANTANSTAQAGFNQANTANSTAQAGFNQANTANTLAQAAFNFANTIVSDTQIDPYARVTANAGFNQANAANSLAQAAFDQANTAGGASLPLANGTSNINIALENGPITLTANVFILTLDETNGSIDLPGNVTNFEACSAINFVANSSGDGVGYSTIQLVPDTNATQDQYIIIDPTAPGHIHVRAGGQQDSSSAELFLGGEESHVKIGAGFNPPVTIKANTYNWDFDVNGELTAPGKIYLNNGIESALTLDQFGIRANTQMILTAENFATGNNSSILFDKNGGGIVFRLEDTTPVSKNWSFYQNSLVFPDSTTQTTAYTGIGTDQYARDTANTKLNLTGGTITGNLVVSGKSTFSGVAELFSGLVDATGVVVHDCANSRIFNHTSIDNNFTANFINLNLNSGEATTLTLVLNQGGTAYIANSVQIGGVAQTIKWSANTVPTGNVNAVDIQSFSILNSSGTYTVLGQLSTFG